MSIATLKRKTNAQYTKVHSHSRDGVGFSINGPRRNMSYIGKDQKMSKLFTPFRGGFPMNHSVVGHNVGGTIVYGVGAGTDIRAHQFQHLKPSVVSSREQMNRMRWCCADIVRTQSVITAGSADLYAIQKGLSNICVFAVDKPDRINTTCPFKKDGRLNCANNYSKDVVPIDSSLRTLNIQQQCALLDVDPSKLFISTGTSRISHAGC